MSRSENPEKRRALSFFRDTSDGLTPDPPVRSELRGLYMRGHIYPLLWHKLLDVESTYHTVCTGSYSAADLRTIILRPKSVTVYRTANHNIENSNQDP